MIIAALPLEVGNIVKSRRIIVVDFQGFLVPLSGRISIPKI
ncbi:hypothetical protein EV14_0182 [Prochlorococcus sp. MIT 0703]|nr:hypothetical protein EV12_1555 [Prochlorococcus sp. MIT 0701]KGG36670.1 hypothetical protein EV14_0182 [Prochlorococcus sp. MIT 0703]